MKQLKVNIRWNTKVSTDLSRLGIVPKDDDTLWEYRPVIVNIHNIAFIDSYQGKLCISFSARDDDSLITDLEFNDKNVALFDTDNKDGFVKSDKYVAT